MKTLLQRAVELADGKGARLTLRLSNSHGECYAVGMIDKNTDKPIGDLDAHFADTLEEAIAKFIEATY